MGNKEYFTELATDVKNPYGATAIYRHYFHLPSLATDPWSATGLSNAEKAFADLGVNTRYQDEMLILFKWLAETSSKQYWQQCAEVGFHPTEDVRYYAGDLHGLYIALFRKQNDKTRGHKNEQAFKRRLSTLLEKHGLPGKSKGPPGRTEGRIQGFWHLTQGCLETLLEREFGYVEEEDK